jgi:hypothetical protein
MKTIRRKFRTAFLGISQLHFAGWECCQTARSCCTKINYLDTVRVKGEKCVNGGGRGRHAAETS